MKKLQDKKKISWNSKCGLKIHGESNGRKRLFHYIYTYTFDSAVFSHESLSSGMGEGYSLYSYRKGKRNFLCL